MRNAPRNLKAGSKKGVTPSSFRVKNVQLFNHKGELFEIQNIIVKVVITESIYSNTLVCKISVRDENNLMQEFPLIGQEKFVVSLSSRSETYDEEDTKLTFYVTEYPLYGKSRNARVQVYTFSGISEHAYLSRFKKISRSVKGLTSKIINDIVESDLKSDKFRIQSDPITLFQGIINNQTPLSAIEWLRKKTYDDKQAPYYFYENLKGVLQLESHTNLVSQKSYFDYINNADYDYDPYSEDDFLQRKHRILSITSDLKMGKIFQAVDGAYASENYYLNFGNKTFTSYTFSYNPKEDSEEKDKRPKLSENSIGGKNAISSQFNVVEDKIDLMPHAHEEYISTNEFAFDGLAMNYNELKKNSKGVTKAYLENMETITHDVRLFGDFNLNAGVMIELKIPKSVDPQVQRDLLKNNPHGIFDEHLSGKYLITSAIHTFEDGEYFTDVKVKRDSFTVDL